METTSASLLLRIRQTQDQEAWGRFVHIYTPLLYYWAQKTGLERAEADDLVQEVFTLLVREMPKFEYDPKKTFRGWLRTVAVRKWTELRRQRKLQGFAEEPGAAVDTAALDPGAAFEDQELRHYLVQRALDVMQTDFPGKTWQACVALVVEERPAKEVAAELGMTVGAVHAARFRVLARVREELAGILD